MLNHNKNKRKNVAKDFIFFKDSSSVELLIITIPTEVERKTKPASEWKHRVYSGDHEHDKKFYFTKWLHNFAYKEAFNVQAKHKK